MGKEEAQAQVKVPASPDVGIHCWPCSLLSPSEHEVQFPEALHDVIPLVQCPYACSHGPNMADL